MRTWHIGHSHRRALGSCEQSITRQIEATARAGAAGNNKPDDDGSGGRGSVSRASGCSNSGATPLRLSSRPQPSGGEPLCQCAQLDGRYTGCDLLPPKRPRQPLWEYAKRSWPISAASTRTFSFKSSHNARLSATTATKILTMSRSIYVVNISIIHDYFAICTHTRNGISPV